MARYSIKPGVDMRDLAPEAWAILDAAAPIYARRGVELVVTAGRDGNHMAGSKHYEGKALDLRTRDLPAGEAANVAAEMRAALGPRYDVVLERTHLHVEFDPKG